MIRDESGRVSVFSGERLFGVLCAGLWAGLLGAWLGWILSQSGSFELLGRILLPLALAATALVAGRALWRTLRGHDRRAKALLALLLVAAGLRFVGADHEVEERAYRDEGTYYHHAQEINQGQVLRFSFVYPHLTYYLDAFTLWTADLYPGLWARAAERVYGVTEPLAREWLTLRLLAALLSTLCVIPVFAMGARLQGLLGAGAGALLIIFSPLFNEGSHLIISDAPSGVFATCCLAFVCRLVQRERRADYLWAGLFAGLAAATKYPAGVVALAIVAAWIRWRWKERSFSWGLLWAGLTAMAAFVAVMPTLLFHPQQAFFGAHGMLFGVRQYAKGGWIGVMPDSTALYYATELAGSFGWPALLLGLAGLVFLAPARRRDLAWLLPYPVAFLFLISSMNMVVRRNLFPVLPILAVVLGVGLGALVAFLEVRARMRLESHPKSLWPVAVPLGVLLAALALPMAATTQATVGFASLSTREAATAWVEAHVPRGASILKESYTPRLDPALYDLRQSRFAARLPVAEIRETADLLILAKPAYHRFLDEDQLSREHHHVFGERYREILETFDKVQEFPPAATRLGPWLEVYRVPPLEQSSPRRLFGPHKIFVPDGNMKTGEGSVRFTLPGQWCQVKGVFPGGSYALRLEGDGGGAGRLVVRTLADQGLADLPFETHRPVHVDLPREDLYYFAFYLGEGSEITSISVEPLEAEEPPAPS